MSTVQEQDERLSQDSAGAFSDFPDDQSIRTKHESLKFSLDPINFDPIRFSFLGPLSSSFPEDKRDMDSTNALGIDLSFKLDSLSFDPPTASAPETPEVTDFPESQDSPQATKVTEAQGILRAPEEPEEEPREEPRPYTLLKPVAFTPYEAPKPKPKPKPKPDLSMDGVADRQDMSRETEDNRRPQQTRALDEMEKGNGEIAIKHAKKETSVPQSPEVLTRDPNVPRHPIATMQGAFAESMYEASEKEQAEKKQQKKRSTPEDAAERRNQLLEQTTSEATHASKWNQKPGQKYHELWKLVAQISFGSYLLFDNIANDDETVLSILQDHVNEVDEFLESTLQDFDHAQEDIDERLRCLKIPMENVAVFDQMLTDRVFRTSIVNGNEQIEHVITRTASAMNDALKHVQQGLSATKDFAIWLANKDRFPSLTSDRPDMQRVYDAMKGNAEGWYKAFVSLQTKGNHLGIALVQLGSIVAEMDRRAGEISRKLRFSTDPRTSPTKPASPPQSPPGMVSRMSRQSVASLNSSKELPNDNMITPAIQATLPAFQYVADRERTPEPESTFDTESEDDEELEILLQPEVFTLQPRVYSPVPPVAKPKKESSLQPEPQRIPSPEPVRIPSPEPEVEVVPQHKEKSTMRQRFSMKRKQVLASPAQGPKPALSPLNQHAPNMPPPRLQPATSTAPRQPSITSNSPRQASIASARPNTATNSPRESARAASVSSQRVAHPATVTFQDSNLFTTTATAGTTFGEPASYYPAADDPVLIPSQLSTPAGSQSMNDSYFPMPPGLAPGGSSPYMSSPRSDQQHFRPVRASPNSPLQRPWTAAPESQVHHSLRHSSSNVAMQTQYSNSHLRDTNTLSTGSRGQSNLNRSTMASNNSDSAMSNMSGITVGMTEDGKKIKKKRSGFGWLKKAFSLSEEERLAFEERRRQTERGGYGVSNGGGYVGQGSGRPETGYGAGRDQPRWLDGKRIR